VGARSAMTLQEAITQTLEKMVAKYSSWESLVFAERRLLVMAYLADELKIREVGGNNRGEWVGILLESVGLDEGYSWCAAALNFASMVAGAPRPKRPSYNPAAVIGWRQWAKAREAKDLAKFVDSPRRGDIAMKRTTATSGHIGVVVRAWGIWCLTIEGNTSSGNSGSQSDGGGLYRRIRLRRWWSWGFARV
jgi:hypothetical protein